MHVDFVTLKTHKETLAELTAARKAVRELAEGLERAGTICELNGLYNDWDDIDKTLTKHAEQIKKANQPHSGARETGE